MIPAGFALFLALYLLPHTRFPSFLGIPVATVWGLMGGGIHYMSLKRGLRFRLRGYALLAAISAFAALGLGMAFPKLGPPVTTCPVCGFVSLQEVGGECPVCGVRFTEVEAAMQGYASLQEYLTAEQMIYFQPSQGDTTVDFFDPCNCPGDFRKAVDWQPSVTAEDVMEVRAMVEDERRVR